MLPSLPSPRAGVYTHGRAEPRDPTVAYAARGLPWDETLSGAAAGVALELVAGEKPGPSVVRWKAVLAGYPYPVVSRAIATVPKGEVPAALIEQARARVASGGAAADIGLVRARRGDEDTWVLLVGDRRTEIGRIPREVELGESIGLTGAEWTVADPSGAVHTPGAGIVPDLAGEWLFRATLDGRIVATFPVYVDVPTPAASPLDTESGEGDAVSEAGAMLAGVRHYYRLSTLQRDSALASVARSRLRTLLDGGRLPEAGAQVRAAGFVNVPIAAAECRASTVAYCLDSIWWSPEMRAVFMQDATAVGVAADVRGDGVTLIILTAG